MNMVELTAVLNDAKTFEFLVNDLNMKHSRDFNPEKENLMAQRQYFIFGPLARYSYVQVDDLRTK
jgi:hypothetical protein